MTSDDNGAAKAISTYHPILVEGELPWYKLWRLRGLRVEPGVAQVLYRHGRPVLVVRPEKKQSIWRIVKSQYTSLASVDVRPYDLTLWGRLPCRGGAHDFGVFVRLTCRVSDPEKIMAGNIRDVGARLHRTIFEQIGCVRHEHRVHDDVIWVQATITTTLEQLSSRLPDLEPAFEVTRLSAEVQIDDGLRSLLRAELEREYAEFVVRKGPIGIAAYHLPRNPKDPQTAIKILRDHRRDLVQLRREEEKYLVENEIVRPQQLEDSALKRLDCLEPPTDEEPMAMVPSWGPGPQGVPDVGVSAVEVNDDFRTQENTNELAS